MNQQPLHVSHRDVKILQERIREFVNDLRTEKVSLNKSKNTDAGNRNTDRHAYTKLNELSPHTGQKGPHHKTHKQGTLERVLRKGNPLALLVGV